VKPSRARSLAGALSLTLLAAAPSPRDPLAADIEQWQAYLAGNASTEDVWTQIKTSSAPVLSAAADALAHGQRELALQKLASARALLTASRYLETRPAADLTDAAAFETEWKRMGGVLAPDLGPLRSDALAGVRSAAARALGEAALPQVREYYESGLEYGQNIMARYGLIYVGIAEGARDFVGFTRTMPASTFSAPAPVRSLALELDALEDALLAAYRPPASIDRHADFIAASASLKEARELDAAGLRYGALYKYLQAAQRLWSGPADPHAAEKLAAFEARLSAGPTDHSLARIYSEMARADLAAAQPGTGAPAASAIVADVLPRYFAALEPARPAAPRPASEVTVTLVRWPYT
jgi:hypothetical protein